MIIESLIGTVLGGVFRVIPELLKLRADSKNHAHELAMAASNREDAKLRGELGLAAMKEGTEAALGVAEFKAITEVSKLQAQKTGVKWADVINAMVRPMLAIEWLIILWPSMIVGGGLLILHYGEIAKEAYTTVFGVEEKAFLCAMGSFWVTDRSLRHIFRVKK